MAVAISSTPSSLLHSSSSSTTGAKAVLCALSYSTSSAPKNAVFTFTPVKVKAKGVYASLFGVGAPEALVIGVVALLVFGPKGLAEEVSREFKSTLEREIGLDEPDNQVPRPSTSNTTKPVLENNTEDSGDNIESNGVPSDSVEESKEDSSKLTAERLTGVLAQLQKEQAEEAERARIQSESQADATQDIPSDTAVVGPNNTLDMPQEEASSSDIISSQNLKPDDLQEVPSGSPSPANTESKA
ncbi:Bacterial sec-independent translocation protein mttA/Hcf106 isoform 1 [Dorcoceras hygrometricum]|uniref:Bacterial sec-independent translocation protein mttA/Hcf106 isoform 1 n=1 Tax=Dorcoceras hygrometricum TaxID=472368 RepID=A0A2Z7C2G6_9LAMI|nr:Bacterial sec-independent translocation protein mttA/Hcf106 isoform 1 [Dorcoceras hygrometricum]